MSQIDKSWALSGELTLCIFVRMYRALLVVYVFLTGLLLAVGP